MGSGTLRLTNALDHQGATIVDGGALQMDGTVSITGFSVNPASTLAGNGSVRNRDRSGGRDGLAGRARRRRRECARRAARARHVTMQAGATLAIDINGPNAGTGYDRLDAIMRADINGATLHVTIGGSPAAFTPAPGTAFVIVTNAIGTFAGTAGRRDRAGRLAAVPHHLRGRRRQRRRARSPTMRRQSPG